MTDKAISPLRQRMIEDMTIRKLAPKTQRDYVQRVKHFAAFLGRSPDTASFEDVRRYQLHLAADGAGVPTLNQSVSTLRFFFRITLGRADIVNHTQFVHEPRKLPVVLSPEEVWTASRRLAANAARMLRIYWLQLKHAQRSHPFRFRRYVEPRGFDSQIARRRN
jgi:site-specific recombinase XerD